MSTTEAEEHPNGVLFCFSGFPNVGTADSAIANRRASHAESPPAHSGPLEWTRGTSVKVCRPELPSLRAFAGVARGCADPGTHPIPVRQSRPRTTEPVASLERLARRGILLGLPQRSPRSHCSERLRGLKKLAAKSHRFRRACAPRNTSGRRSTRPPAKLFGIISRRCAA